VIQLAVSRHVLERLLTFGADSEDLEHGDEDEDESPAVLSLDQVPPRRISWGTTIAV
jgi:hypothetical protein